MKSIKIVVFLSIILLSGCIKDTLDRKPLNLISDADVWKSESLIDIYLVGLYDALPIDLGSYLISYFTDESTSIGYNQVSNFGNSVLNSGMYSWIRQANYFIQQVQTATIPEAKIKQYIAECRFIRAFYYLELVKIYGGMPIIEDVQVFSGNLEKLQVPRNTEEEVYDFILKELDAAIADLPDSWDVNNANRATKMIAQAYKSRAALYAGSIAKYGTVQLDGLIGIPASKANTYFTESMNDSKAVMESNKYGLYDKSYNPVSKVGNPVKNYQDIFLDKNNKEVIFQKAYFFPDKVHSWDNWMIPEGFTTNMGSLICPLLDMVESYEYIDGTPGILDVEGKVFNSPDDLFGNKDPRCDATIFRSESPYIIRNVQIYRGIYDVDNTLYETVQVPFPKDPSRMEVGLDGPYPSGRYSKTGFYLKKMMNEDKIVVEPNSSDQNFIDCRYAEILLNYAEAAVETGTDLSQALDAINQVRNRAGIKTLNASELTIERVRNERKVELAFENKRFYDIRRWRIGTELFNSTFMRGLYPYLKYDGTSYKYIFKIWSGFPLDGGLSRIWEEKDYYSNLSDYISTNKNIINNPGW